MSAITIIHLILAALAILFGRLAIVLARPVMRCPRCKGERVTRSRWTGRMGGCPRCHRQGRCYRRGATWVHRVKWIIVAELRDIRDGRRDRKADS
jgi:hypothetical protein